MSITEDFPWFLITAAFVTGLIANIDYFYLAPLRPKNQKMTVIGIVQNYHYASLKDTIQPLLMKLDIILIY